MALRFEKMLSSGALAEDATYDTAAGAATGILEIAKVYAIDVAYDSEDDIPKELLQNRRFAPVVRAGRKFSISSVAEQVGHDFGRVDILVHAIANGPEVARPLLETSRVGYLAAQASSAYSFVSLLRHFAPLMAATPERPGGAVVSLTYIAADKVIPGYGGGMSSAKAALESDTRTLAYEAGRSFGIRVNTISAGPLKSRAASAIKKASGGKAFIERAIDYSRANAPLVRDLTAADVANAAVFLASPAAGAVTGTTLYVDNGLHVMGMGLDSPTLAQ